MIRKSIEFYPKNTYSFHGTMGLLITLRKLESIFECGWYHAKASRRRTCVLMTYSKNTERIDP